ncbi:MAG: DUF4831 family protein [Prevotellaceae bacterium]|jgi:hypothetical protein|nr:DUF4831 family protein [Prevotellaceae bacterium]
MRKKTVFILIVSVLTLNAQTKVTPVINGTIPKNCVTYFLPKTQLQIAVYWEKTICKPAPFANYAKRLLALENVITQEKTEYKITEVEIYYAMIKDSTKYYAVEINPKSVACKIGYSESGIIKSVNYLDTEAKNTPLLVRATTPNFDERDTITFDYSCLSQDAIQATSIAKTAELAAKQIFEIRENRMDLLSGNSEAKFEGETLELVINRLDKAEESLLNLFTGKTATIHLSKTFEYMPKINETEEILFRFSSLLGVVDRDDLSGRPITIDIKANLVSEHLSVENTKKTKTYGIFYNVCGSSEFSIFDSSKLLQSIELQVPQFGYTKFLPATAFNQNTTAVIFSEFGAIRQIK